MLQFLQPLWLWATAGIIIPVLIHLWKVKEGKILKVGSIVLLNAAAEKSAKSIELNQLLLLLLRCLLIIFIALLMAGPQWVQTNKNDQVKGWVIINPQNSEPAYEQYARLIDSLESSGYRFKSWDTLLSTVKKADAVASQKSTANNSLPTEWDIIEVLNSKLAAGSPVYLFTPGRLNQLSGRRPSTDLAIQLYEYDEKMPAASVVQHAHLINTDSVLLTLGKSSASGNTIETIVSDLDRFENDSVKITRQNNKYYAAFKGSKSAEVDEKKYAVTIFAEKTSPDAIAIASAFKAIAQYTRYNFSVAIKNLSDSTETDQDWIFWLSDKSMPAALKAGYFFEYATGKKVLAPSVIVLDKNYLTDHPMSLFQSIEAGSQKDGIEKIIWKDGFGRPVLTSKIHEPNRYLFYSRFRADWNDLIWDPVFPAVIFDLVIGEKYLSFPGALDQRKADGEQLMPLKTNASDKLRGNAPSDSLAIYNWWLLLLLFVAERIISTKKKSKHID